MSEFFQIPRKRTLSGMRSAIIRKLDGVSRVLDAMQLRNPHLGLGTSAGEGYTDTLRYRVLAMYESRLEALLARVEAQWKEVRQ